MLFSTEHNIIMECVICIEKFNKIRKSVRCPYCQHETCHKCVEKYLIENTIVPQCMNCKREWNMEFLRTYLPRTFMDNKYKEHQKEAIFSEAETNLGQYQRQAQLEMEKEKQQENVRQAKIQLEEAKNHYKKCCDVLWGIQSSINAETSCTGNSNSNRRDFFMACPIHPCRGKLSSVYKCGMCEHWICPECHQDKGLDKNIHHECKKEDVETVKMLKDNTRPCPKCHIGIYKTEGCDQMWCVQCHTCFSWRTGNILNGVIHNPHFYEYQRRIGGGQAPRVLGDVPCGGMPTHFEIARRQRRIQKTIHDDWVFDLYQYMMELVDYEMPSIYRKFNSRPQYHRKYGVQYLMNKITRVKWIDMLYRVLKQEEKYRRYYQVLETLNVNVSEYLRQYVRGENAEVIHQYCNTVFQYANEECEKMRKQYNMNIPVLKVVPRSNRW